MTKNPICGMTQYEANGNHKALLKETQLKRTLEPLTAAVLIVAALYSAAVCAPGRRRLGQTRVGSSPDPADVDRGS